MDRKGQGTILLMVAVIAAAMISGLVAMVMVQNLPGIFGQYVDDAGIVAEAEMRKDNLENNYIPLSAQYAVAQGSWEIGIANRDVVTLVGVDDDEGSESADYNNEDERSDEVLDGSDTGSTGQRHQDRMDKVQSRSQTEFDSYVKDFGVGHCQVSMVDDADIDLGWKDDWINVTPHNGGADQLVNVTCGEANKKVFSKGEKEEFITEMTNNMFPDLSSIMDVGMTEMENVSEQIEKNGNHQGQFTVNATHPDDSYCPGYTSTSNAIDAAEQEAMEEVYDGDWSDGHPDKISEIQQAIMMEPHGIGSGGERGAVDALKKELTGNKACIPFTSFCVTISQLDWLQGDLEKSVSLINNDTQTQVTSSNAYRCGCSGSTSCPNADGDATDEYVVSGDYNSCVKAVSNPGPSCQEEDYSYSSGSCTLNGDETPAPSPCSSGNSLNASNDWCEDSSNNVVDSSPDCDDPNNFGEDGDEDWSYDGSADSCVHDTSASPDCAGNDYTYSSGSCNWVHTSYSGSPSCSGSWEYNADVTMKWEIDSIKVNVSLKDDERTIPTDDGWKNLIVSRRYYREFADMNYIN